MIKQQIFQMLLFFLISVSIQIIIDANCGHMIGFVTYWELGKADTEHLLSFLYTLLAQILLL